MRFKKILPSVLLASSVIFLACTVADKTTSDKIVTATELNEKTSKAKIGLNIGDKAPEINLPDPNGKMIALSDLKGKMVLIDFWASWCGPCRRENPNVVKTYNTFKDTKFENGKGFTVFSVSLDKNKSSWQNGIMQDKLVWPNHVSDLRMWQTAVRADYKFSGIPYAILIDGDGIIVGKGQTVRGQGLPMLLNNLKKK